MKINVMIKIHIKIERGVTKYFNRKIMLQRFIFPLTNGVTGKVDNSFNVTVLTNCY